MPRKLEIQVSESISELQKLQLEQSTLTLNNRVQLLILLKMRNYEYQSDLVEVLPVCLKSIKSWIKTYREGGIDKLLSDERKGRRLAKINGSVYQEVKAKLEDPKSGLSSYVELHDYLKEKGIEINYRAMYYFVRRHFNTSLKVGRKSHIKKSDAAVAVFKNGEAES